MSFYQVVRLPNNSIHGTIESSNREESDAIKCFNELREKFKRDGTFVRDIKEDKFETTTDRWWWAYHNY